MRDDSIRLQMTPIEVRKSSTRQTPIDGLGMQFRAGLTAGARVVNRVATTAGYAIPGAAVVGAAVNGMAESRDIAGQGGDLGLTGNGLADMGSGLGGSGGGAMEAIAGRARQGDGSAQLMLATQKMQEMNQEFNLQYLQLQERTQHESRQFSAISNVMKTKHDTARNALSNLK